VVPVLLLCQKAGGNCYEWGKDGITITTNVTYPWSFVTQIFRNGLPGHGCDHKTLEEMTPIKPQWILDLAVYVISFISNLIG
jgi:hypothetical protein